MMIIYGKFLSGLQTLEIEFDEIYYILGNGNKFHNDQEIKQFF